MKIGDRVKYESDAHINNGRKYVYGIIVSDITPTCRCKGRGEWVVSFDDLDGQNIPVSKRGTKLTLVEEMGITQNIEIHKL